MELFIVRHGQATELSTKKGAHDDDRDLTSIGKKESKNTAKALRTLDHKPDLILTSPLIRALHTAKIIDKVLSPGKGIIETDLLKPDASLEELITELNKRKEKTILLTGHNPKLTNLISLLICKSESAQLTLSKSGVCCISFGQKVIAGKGTLVWFMQPEHLKRIG